MATKIAVAGEIRSGKDTVCEYIKDKVPHMETLYFAMGIKEILLRYFPESFEGNSKPRKYYQEVGQFMRTLNPDVWVNYTAQEYLYLQSYYGIESFIVTDLRQPNEYNWLKENGFTVVKVEAEPEIRIERMQKAGDSFEMQDLLHPVELEIRNLKYDYLITNNTTLEDLYKQVDFILKDMQE